MVAGYREMTANEGAGSVLIVATDRDDRRILFDALDAQEFDAIYTAKDVAQARRRANFAVRIEPLQRAFDFLGHGKIRPEKNDLALVAGVDP